jgi:Tol biopolymer transport system component
MRLHRAAPILGLALLAGVGCNSDAPNPFVPPTRANVIPTDATLLFTSDAYTTAAGAGREVFAVRTDGGNVQRLTFCNGASTACDTAEAVASPDRSLLLMRRALSDTNRDGRIYDTDDAALIEIDLRRGLEAPIVPATSKVTGVDWSFRSELVAFAGVGQDGTQDLYLVDSNGKNLQTLLPLPGTEERNPRLDRNDGSAVFERCASDGSAQIWVLGTTPRQVTRGGPASGTRLPGNGYAVGADATPDFSPDATNIVFRRLTGTGLPPYGTWDIVRVAADGSGERVLATGARYRGAPDWGTEGIAFAEFDGRAWTIVVLSPDGVTLRTPVTLAGGQTVSSVRWLPPVR